MNTESKSLTERTRTPRVPGGTQREGEYPATAVRLAPARYVLLPLAQVLTGYTVKAMERKIERGDWPEGKVWRHAPDGRIVIDLQGYQRWVENQ